MFFNLVSILSANAPIWWHKLPAINACLNAISATLLLIGFILIKRGQVKAHATLMISALVTSTVFLGFYVLHHTLKLKYEGSAVTRFPDGPWRKVYLAVLWPHLLLAMVMLPFIFASVFLAWRRNWALHRKVSVITFPVWFFVSVSGVIVYYMLYWLAPTLGRH